METRSAREIIPDLAIHPGEHLAEEVQARGMSQRELARRMGRPVQAINEIVRGRKRITADTALDLAEVLGIPASFWVNLQARYDLVAAVQARKRRAAS